MDRLDYDRLAGEYNSSLTDKLRGHGARGFLEHWVPDEDPVRGIINMIEAAEIECLDRISIQVSSRTLDKRDLDRLRELAAGLAVIGITAQKTSFVINARDIGRQDATTRRDSAAASPSAPTTPGRREASNTSRETVNIHPSLAAGLAALRGEALHEGTAPPPQGSTRYSYEQGGVSLSLDVLTDGRIAQAQHQSVTPRDRRMLVDLMCGLIEGRTVQDASDHAGGLAIDRLRSASGATRPVPGVLLVANAGEYVAAALRLVRGACQTYMTATGAAETANFFEAPPSPAWMALTSDDRLARILAAIPDFVASGRWPADSITPLSVDEDLLGYPVRVLVHLNDGLPTQAKPSVLRDLERWLKGCVEPKLQVHLVPLKDKNSIRRL